MYMYIYMCVYVCLCIHICICICICIHMIFWDPDWNGVSLDEVHMFGWMSPAQKGSWWFQVISNPTWDDDQGHSTTWWFFSNMDRATIYQAWVVMVGDYDGLWHGGLGRWLGLPGQVGIFTLEKCRWPRCDDLALGSMNPQATSGNSSWRSFLWKITSRSAKDGPTFLTKKMDLEYHW